MLHWSILKLRIAKEWFLKVVFGEIPRNYYDTGENANELYEQMQLTKPCYIAEERLLYLNLDWKVSSIIKSAWLTICWQKSFMKVSKNRMLIIAKLYVTNEKAKVQRNQENSLRPQGKIRIFTQVWMYLHTVDDNFTFLSVVASFFKKKFGILLKGKNLRVILEKKCLFILAETKYSLSAKIYCVFKALV